MAMAALVGLEQASVRRRMLAASMTTRAPWGTWDSPLTPERMAAGARRLAAPRWVDGALIYCESRPDEGGRTTLCRRRDGGGVEDLVPAPWDVGTRVHEYGGRAWVECGDALVFGDRRDGRLWWRRADGAITAITAASPWRFAEPIFDRRRGRLLAVGERTQPGTHPHAAIVAIGLDDGAVTVLCEGADFYASPVLSDDGTQLAWLQWQHPDMPWDAGAVWRAALGDDGRPRGARHVVGDADASAQQPAFDRRGRLFALWEPEGAWTLWRFDDDGSRHAVVRDVDARRELELGAAMWNLGLRTWALLDDDTAVAAAVHRGLSRVVRIDLRDGGLTTIADRPRTIGHLVAADGRIAVLQGWDGRGTALQVLDRGGACVATIDTGIEAVLPPPWWSQPQAIAFETTDGDTAHGWLYLPHHPDVHGPDDTRPPLVVMAHGGPTGGAIAQGQLAVQFWTTRGFAVLDVNYRGSTGFGRAYRERLRGHWGVRDVDDCVAGARHLATTGVVDARRMVIRGASAGGFTVLAALAFHQVFAAGASLYGVSDVESLVRDTHKFEAHYDRFLFGAHDDPRPVWRARSPLFAADRIAVPVIFFQGSDDLAVPPSQTESMVAALRARGVEVEYRRYEGEGHGFRRAENIVDGWAAELAFFRRVLALT